MIIIIKLTRHIFSSFPSVHSNNLLLCWTVLLNQSHCPAAVTEIIQII